MTPHDAATLKAIGDATVATGQEMERKWGVGRLPVLTGLEWAERFERTCADWREALDAAYDSRDGQPLAQMAVERVRTAADRLRRAWATLDRVATEKGCSAISGEVWEAVRSDGAVIAIVPTVADACKVVTEGRYVACYTLDEIANVIAALPAALAAAKQEWPGARVIPQRETGRSKFDWANGDSIPF